MEHLLNQPKTLVFLPYFFYDSTTSTQRRLTVDTSLQGRMKTKNQLLADTIRVLSAEGVQAANSGHPGMPLGAADYAALIWAEELRFNSKDPEWLGRDYFVLSAGHGSMLLYSLIHLFGYNLPMEELKNFRQWASKTPGHPEYGMTPGVETTTGPLGQGVANGVGLALSAKMMAARYGEDLFSNRVFGIVSDGDLMEGVAAEASSLAGHLKLNNLVYFYDDNEITIGGRTDICFTESVKKRYESYGWFVQEIDGHDEDQIRTALKQAVLEGDRPSLVCAKTVIGKGAPTKADSSGVHGSPLGDEELGRLKEALGWKEEPFTVPAEVSDYLASLSSEKEKSYQEWQEKYEAWKNRAPEECQAFLDARAGKVTAALQEELIQEISVHESEATRSLSGKAIQVIARHLPHFVGGSADLEPSNNTLMKESSDITASDFSGRNIRFGIREHAMGAMVNGLAYTKSWTPFSATFLVFADYMRPTIRLAALSHLGSIFIFTHDSFWVGEDGPTHQPIEQLESLRIIPNLDVYRPADGLEVALCYVSALQRRKAPSSLLFTRQKLPCLKREEGFDTADILKGGYVLESAKNPDLVLIATGSEVGLAVDSATRLRSERGLKVQVVSMPCRELFLRQEKAYQNAVLPSGVRRVVIEAGIKSGWYQITGENGLVIGRDEYGASAPGERLAEEFGFSVEGVLAQIEESV